jgi:hypothetical protein
VVATTTFLKVSRSKPHVGQSVIKMHAWDCAATMALATKAEQRTMRMTMHRRMKKKVKSL